MNPHMPIGMIGFTQIYKNMICMECFKICEKLLSYQHEHYEKKKSLPLSRTQCGRIRDLYLFILDAKVSFTTKNNMEISIVLDEIGKHKVSLQNMSSHPII